MATDINVEHLAQLAQLAVSETQAVALKEELNSIFNLVDVLTQKDTQSIEPLAHPLNQTQPLRVDEINAHNQRERFLENAPLTKYGLYTVPSFLTTE